MNTISPVAASETGEMSGKVGMAMSGVAGRPSSFYY